MNGLIPTPLPWQSQAWDRLRESVEQERLAHALLFSGPAGTGKRIFAQALAAFILCHQRSGQACGECASCRHVAAGTHPDLLELSPEAPGKGISVEAVREFNGHLFLTSQYRIARVGVIQPAEAMTLNAANGLLKTLEEPPAGSHILLVSDRLMSLPATIRSRCQIVNPGRPSPDIAGDWLRNVKKSDAAGQILEYAQAPLEALRLAEQDYAKRKQDWARALTELLRGDRDVVEVSEQWQSEDIPLVLSWLYTWVLDLLRIQTLGPGVKLMNDSWIVELRRQAGNYDSTYLVGLLDTVVEARMLLETQANQQSIMETLLIKWITIEG